MQIIIVRPVGGYICLNLAVRSSGTVPGLKNNVVINKKLIRIKVVFT